MTKEEGPCVSPRRVRVAQKGHGSATGPAASLSTIRRMFTYTLLSGTRGVYRAVDPDPGARWYYRARREYCLFFRLLGIRRNTNESGDQQDQQDGISPCR